MTDFTKCSFGISEMYSELSQTPKMGSFAKKVAALRIHLQLIFTK